MLQYGPLSAPAAPTETVPSCMLKRVWWHKQRSRCLVWVSVSAPGLVAPATMFMCVVYLRAPHCPSVPETPRTRTSLERNN